MKLRYNDKAHGYWLTLDEADAATWGTAPFNGARCKSVTAIAKVPEDTYNIDRWQKRMVAIGLAKSPHLLESVAAHKDDKSKLNELCEMAQVAAGTDEASERGTTAHRITELVDGGIDFIPTPTALRVAERWRALIEAAGIEIVPDLMERVVVYPVQRICGKFDRMGRVLAGGAVAARYPHLVGKLVTLDLKTGSGAVKYPHSVATQLATYANAPLIAGAWEGLDGETTSFEPLPAELDRSIGLIVHLTEDEGAVYEIDLAIGWRCVEKLIFPTLRWRAIPARDLIGKVVELV